MVISRDAFRERRYWHLSFQSDRAHPLNELCEEILDLTRDSIRRRASASKALGIFLSGGMDSSSIAALTRDVYPGKLSTFSYRCRGRSFDESQYARLMAAHCDADHHEVVFEPAAVEHMASMAQHMDEPLCNAGITVATHLLAHAATGRVDTVLTGDGGDELFGGHPVYAADRIATVVDRIPGVFRRALFRTLRRLPDTDRKLDMTVKLKRFAESAEYPRDLHTYRWRIQYGPEELQELLGPGITTPDAELFGDVRQLMSEADGPDILSRSLYMDTVVEVGFYMRRMDLVRAHGVTPAFPMLDHRLFEFAARIPSQLKFRSASNTKYIQHLAMKGVLPDAIVHRKDKLGHSIPFKNWLRDEDAVKSFVLDALSSNGLGRRGLVDNAYVKRLWDAHQSHRQNHSHRLWSLTVLELWLRAHGF
jgi:asparagine synthase (glutamine-hydrolysing)